MRPFCYCYALSFSPVDVHLSNMILIAIISQPSTTLILQRKVTILDFKL